MTIGFNNGVIDLLFPPRFHLVNLYEKEGYKDNADGDGNNHSEEDAGTDGVTAGRPGTRGEYQGQHAENEGQGGHQDRAEAGSPAVMAACTASTPLSTSTLANSTMRMAFLAASPSSVTSPIWK